MIKLATRLSNKAIAWSAVGLVVTATGVTTALARAEAPQTGTVAAAAARPAQVPAPAATPTAVGGKPLKLQPKGVEKRSALPAGVSTGTSFWDAGTASGKPMSYHTLASPYWPLGTVVKIMYGKKSATGVVEDFGPAEWAVAQHNPPAIVDLSEEMMQDLTGTRSNSVTIKFQVLKYGDGPVYRHAGTGFDMATGVSSK
jgi:hypothetical protein